MDIPQVVRDKNDAYWLFWVYQAACMPSMTSWARKKNKGKLLKGIDEIIGNVDKKNRKSLRNVNPTAFKNIVEMLNAIDGNGQDFKDKFLQFSPESKAAKRINSFREFYTECNHRNDMDEMMRLCLIFIIVHEGLRDLEGKDKGLIRTIALQTLSAFEVSKGNPSVWEIETDIPRWELIVKGLSEKFLSEDFDTNMEDMGLVWTQDVIQEMFSWNDIYINDFFKTQCGRKDLEKICKLLMIQMQNQYGILDELDCVQDLFDDDGINTDVLDKLQEKFGDMAADFEEALFAAVLFYRMCLMYKNARDEANRAIEESIDLKNEIRELKDRKVLEEEKARRKLGREKDVSLAEDKQKQLNKLQSDYEKLQEKYREIQAENRFLGELLKNAEESGEEDEGEEPDDGKVSQESRAYPKGTVLFGGHENWQRKYAARHPEVKILSGTEDFAENVVSNKTSLVLLNSHHMSHKVFYKIRRLQQRLRFRIEYVK